MATSALSVSRRRPRPMGASHAPATVPSIVPEHGPHAAVIADELPQLQLGAGCVRRNLPSPPGARAWLVEMAPGAEWPWADRLDTGEAYYVLSGEVIEGDARHRAGTQVLFAPGTRHRPRSDIGARLLGFHLEPDAYLGAGGNPETMFGRLHLQQG